VNYKVNVKLRTTNLFDIESRINEVLVIREWVEQLVEYNEDLFEIRYRSSGESLDIWFEEEKHALMCELRWV